jgi:hypothetical protein
MVLVSSDIDDLLGSVGTTSLGRLAISGGRTRSWSGREADGALAAQAGPALVLALAARDAVRLLDAMGPAPAGGRDGAGGTDRLRAGHPPSTGRTPFAVGMKENLEIHVPAGGLALPVPVGHQCSRESGYIGHDDHLLLRKVVAGATRE